MCIIQSCDEMPMISIIICGRQATLSAEMQTNIASTIGCDYELVVIDNSLNRYSIFQAYNEGVKRAKGDILCFVHDDVLFRTDNWGTIVTDLLKDDSIGIVGFAGTHFLPSVPMYWTESPYISEHNLTNDQGKVLQCFHDAYFSNEMIDALACDGFCFFIPKTMFNDISFDESTFNGFHMYDMDICMQIYSRGKRLVITDKVLIEHFWSESLAPTKKGMNLFDKNLILFFEKWKPLFPLLVGIDLPAETLNRINRLCIRAYDAKVARNSASYKLGHFLLAPLKWLQSIFK